MTISVLLNMMIKKVISNKMDVIFIGSGSERNYQLNRRKNTSLLMKLSKGNMLIDCGDSFPDNWNLYREKNTKIEFPKVLFITHAHIDHFGHYQAFNHYAKKEGVRKHTTIMSEETFKRILENYDWLKKEDFGNLKIIKHGDTKTVLGSRIKFFKLKHSDYGKYQVDTWGIRVGDTAYLPDNRGIISDESFNIIKGVKRIIAECVFIEQEHEHHSDLNRVIGNARKLYKHGLEELVLTHFDEDFPVSREETEQIIFSLFPREPFKIIASEDLMKI